MSAFIRWAHGGDMNVLLGFVMLSVRRAHTCGVGRALACQSPRTAQITDWRIPAISRARGLDGSACARRGSASRSAARIA
eukprot:7762450-Alexandrium_andersonii.AAC.1